MIPATLAIISAPFRRGSEGWLRHLGRRLRDGARNRATGRRAHHRAHQLELDLLRQRPGRSARHVAGVARDRRVARHLGRAEPRPARDCSPPASGCSRSRSRLIEANPTAGRRRRSSASSAARPQGSPCSSGSSGTGGRRCSTSRCSETRPSPARTSSPCSSPSRCSASSSSCPSTFRRSSATRRSRRGRSSCR